MSARKVSKSAVERWNLLVAFEAFDLWKGASFRFRQYDVKDDGGWTPKTEEEGNSSGSGEKMMGRIWLTWKALLYNRVVECVSGQRLNTSWLVVVIWVCGIAKDNHVLCTYVRVILC